MRRELPRMQLGTTSAATGIAPDPQTKTEQPLRIRARYRPRRGWQSENQSSLRCESEFRQPQEHEIPSEIPRNEYLYLAALTITRSHVR
jgi:hypothetical protein